MAGSYSGTGNVSSRWLNVCTAFRSCGKDSSPGSAVFMPAAWTDWLAVLAQAAGREGRSERLMGALDRHGFVTAEEVRDLVLRPIDLLDDAAPRAL